MSPSPGADMSGSDRETGRSTGVITFLDVLGWKGIYAREKTPLKKMFRLIDDIRDAASLFGSERHQVRSISDTIVLYSKITDVSRATITSTVGIHGHVCAKAIVTSIGENIPVRGATAVGEFEVDGNVYVGKAIDEAASWFESADWIGVHLTPSASFTVDGELLLLDDNHPLSPWANYEPPVKNMPRHHAPCVAWVDAWRKSVPLDQDPRQQLLLMFSEMGPITPDFAMKFVNTLKYFDDIAARQKSKTTSE